MRSTCRADRKIVDSTELYIPRLRISFLEGFLQATIYTGIGQFLKVEFNEKKEEVEQGGLSVAYVYRMENEVKWTDNTAARRIKGIPASRLFGVFLRHQFIRPNVLLGTLEFEFHPTDHNTQIFCICLLMRSFGEGKVFRAKKLATNCLTKKLTEIYLYNNLIDKTIMEGMYNEEVMLAEECAYPQKMIDITVFPDPELDVFKGTDVENPRKMVKVDLEPIQKFVKVPHCESYFYTTEYRQLAPSTVSRRVEGTEGFVTCRFGDTSDVCLWDHQIHPVQQLNEHVQMKRVAVPMIDKVYRWNKSKCGIWTHAMKIENEHKFEEFFKNEKCGLLWLCKTCTDPFDYWYYRNLPKRILDEKPTYIVPKYTEEGKYGDMVREQVKLFQEKYKNEKLKKSKGKAPWGFKKREGRIRTSNVRFRHPVDFEDGDLMEKNGASLGFERNANFVIKTFWCVNPKQEPNDIILGAPVVNMSKIKKEPGLFSKINKAMGSWSPFGQAEEAGDVVPPQPPREGTMTVEEYAAWLTDPTGPARDFTFSTDEKGETVVHWKSEEEADAAIEPQNLQTFMQLACEHEYRLNKRNKPTVIELD